MRDEKGASAMDPEIYRQWQELHRRMVLGKTLNASEQEAYEAGCRELDAAEELDGSLDQIRKLREQIFSADAAQQRLREQEAELDARIAALEARLDTRTRQLLGIGN
jgi:chromosome segregation ATPase